MLLEERAESERLRQIIKALQRHRFGRRAESLPEDQLLLGLEEAEQVEAAGHAQAEKAAPAETAPPNRRGGRRGRGPPRRKRPRLPRRPAPSGGRTGARCRPTCHALRPLWTSRARS